ncbi:hypothetical protein PR048_001107 [Dryococelus australis]|uniref:Uncharacterized protein n=1 Tax=Dryococelus australis TaxID=614101 RepID=A0ABQ9IGJ5_9NEOP|nr:hypothetical protein PR048_001107 [Dryococelus australis]
MATEEKVFQRLMEKFVQPNMLYQPLLHLTLILQIQTDANGVGLRDLFSRCVEVYPLTKINIKAIVDVMEKEFFPRWGYPCCILTNTGP